MPAQDLQHESLLWECEYKGHLVLPPASLPLFPLICRAENVDAELAKIGFENLGVEERKNLAVLRRTTMPAILIETGFIDSDKDNYLFDYRFEDIVNAIALGIDETLRG